MRSRRGSFISQVIKAMLGAAGGSAAGNVVSGGVTPQWESDPSWTDSYILSNGDRTVTANGGSWDYIRAASQFGKSSGKWVFECVSEDPQTADYPLVGLCQEIENTTDTYGFWTRNISNGWAYNSNNGYLLGSYPGDPWNSPWGSVWQLSGDYVSCAVDFDAGKIYFAVNGVWQGGGNPETGAGAAFTTLNGANGPFFPAVSFSFGVGNEKLSIRDPVIAIPTGFSKWVG